MSTVLGEEASVSFSSRYVDYYHRLMVRALENGTSSKANRPQFQKYYVTKIFIYHHPAAYGRQRGEM